MYFLKDVANFSEITEEDRIRSKQYARRGAIGYGVTNTVLNIPKVIKSPASKSAKAVGLALGLGVNAGVGYGAGKLLSRLRRGSDNQQNGKSFRKKKVANYNRINENVALFRQVNPNDKPQTKRNWLRTGAKVATVGALGLGVGAAATGGMLHLANKGLKKQGDQNIKNKVKSAFDTLGIGETNNMSDIKKAYRKSSLKNPTYKHPDVGGTREGFEKLESAYRYTDPNSSARIKDLSDLTQQQDKYNAARNFYYRNGAKLGGVGAVGASGLYLTKPKKQEESSKNRLQQLKSRYFNR